MRIRLLSPIFIAGQPHTVGEVIEVEDALGNELARSRKAVPWSSPVPTLRVPEPPVIESEMMETPEKAVLPRARGKPLDKARGKPRADAKRSEDGETGG